MKAAFVCFAALLVVAGANSVTPVQKVVELMNDMLSKAKKEMQDEQVQFATYKTFCENTAVSKQKAIAEAEEMIDGLKADIEKYTAKAEKLGQEVAAHDEDISVWTGDKKATTKVRKMEKADYDATHKDYSESVSALERAITVLKAQNKKTPQSSLLEVSALTQVDLIPPAAKKALAVFLQNQLPSDDEGLEVSAPEADGYSFQSKGVIDMLNKLLDEFIAERTKLEKEEDNTKQAYDMLMQDLTEQLREAKEDREEKSALKAKKLQAKADATGDLEDTTTTMQADQQYLKDLVSTCEQKAADYESRQQLREEEIEAVNKAIDIISGNAVSGAADKHLPGFIQQKSTSLAQLRSGYTEADTRARVAMYLRDRAFRIGSKVLSALALRVSSDPFGKVKKLIKDLIVRLMEEATEEAEHKGYCDTELATNEKTRVKKTMMVETLHAEIDQLEASIAKLTEDITELTQQVADLDSAMAEATKLREEEKAKNTETIEDSQAAHTAVTQALTVLKEFYAKAAEATALVQEQPEAPEIFDKPYKGMQAENGGVIGMLEVIQSDFARLEADTKGSEASALKEYETFMTDSKVDKASKSSDIEHKSSKLQDQEQTLVVKKEDLEGTQKELDAALDYFDKLKPSCVDAGVTYEDRVGRRKEEIESLQDALRILNGEDIA